MNINVLAENSTASQPFECEHGLSLYVKTDADTFLFDFGQTDLFQRNAHRAGLSLADVDFAVLSHGHYDHGGGLETFFSANDHAPVFLSRHAFGHYFNASGKYIGLDPQTQRIDRMVATDECHTIRKGISLFSCNLLTRKVPAATCGLTMADASQQVPDLFLHEQYLCLTEGGKRYLFSGCSHKGILNIIHWFEPDVFIGGFHLMHANPETAQGRTLLYETAQALLKYPTEYYTGHCTGAAAYDYLRVCMKDKLHQISAGMCLTL